MAEAHSSLDQSHRSRLFFGICFALIPTGASFAIVGNILTPLKQEFILTNYRVGLIGGAALWGMALSLLVIGPMLETFGLKTGARLAFLGHIIGLSLMIFASTKVGDPSAFWYLMAGAATLAAGNGMIEVTGNPLVAALYPEEKTKRLNWFHAFFPIGIIAGGIVGFLLVTYGGKFGHWPWQLAFIYLPMLVYGYMVLGQTFPKTENAEAGLPIGEMFKYTFSSPLMWLMLAMMAITTSMELGPMRWIPSVLQFGGMNGILVLVWISGWMCVLRLLSGHAIAKLAPSGMLLMAAILVGSGLFALSFAHTTMAAFAAATIFAFGVAFFFPTMVGSVSERMPKTGSLGIVLTAGVGLGMAGLVGVPWMGSLADRYLAESLPATETSAVLQKVATAFPDYIAKGKAATDPKTLGYTVTEVEGALEAVKTALAAPSVQSDESANALRAVVGTAIPNEPLIGEASGILGPAEADGGQHAFRYIAPLALVLIVVFALMYLNDRRKGGYRAVRLEKLAILLALGLAAAAAPTKLMGQARGAAAPARAAATAAKAAQPRNVRMKVLFLGDNDIHRPYLRIKQILPYFAQDGIDLFYTSDPADLNTNNLKHYDAIMLYNNQPAISPAQLTALKAFVSGGKGLIGVHSASASFQNSPEFIALLGGAFKSHDTLTFTAVRTAPDHPAIKDVPTITSWDETYVHDKLNPVGRTILEVRRQNGVDEPWTWVRTYGKGRVFYTAWGHDEKTWGNAAFQALLDRGTRWAVGDWGLLDKFTGPQIVMNDLAFPLPIYGYDIGTGRGTGPQTERSTAQVALTTDESLMITTLRPGFKATSFAVEPMIGNIMDFTWDARGRMWAIEANDYPSVILPDSVPGHDRILIIEDTNRDGKADKVSVFATGLNLASTLVLANGGVIVGQAPHMLFYKDTDGDDKADVRKVLSTGWSRSDTHGVISNLRYGIDNRVIGSLGYNGFIGTVGPSTYVRGGGRGGPINTFGSGYFTLPVDGSDLEYMAKTGNNTWGVSQTEDGFIFGSTANSNPQTFVPFPARYYRNARIPEPTLRDVGDRLDIFPNREALQVDQFGRYTAGAGSEIYTARAFPREYWNNVSFVAEPTAHLVGMFALHPTGSVYRTENKANFLASQDAWVAPVQAKVGPDGAVWISDFYTLVAQHNPTPRGMQTGPGAAYVTPNRDGLHGRIYRVSYDSGRAAPPMRLDNATPAQLVAALKNDNMFWRLTAQRLLVERGKLDVVPGLIALANTRTVDALGLNPGALHALWTLHGLGALKSTPAALAAARAALTHPAASIRRAAVQMLPRDASLNDALYKTGILSEVSGKAGDKSGPVRLVAVLALSELPASPRNAAVIADMMGRPENTHDNWMMDALAIAGSKQGPEFLIAQMPLAPKGGVPQGAPGARGGGGGGAGTGAIDTLAPRNIRRADSLMAFSLATSANSDNALAVLRTVSAPANSEIAPAVIGAFTAGWPATTAPNFTALQKAELIAVARALPALETNFAALATKWQLPDLFKN